MCLISSGGKVLIENLYRFEKKLSKNTGKIFEDKLQQKKVWILL